MMMNDKANKLAIIGAQLDNIVDIYDVSYMEACIMYCDKYEVEIELLGELITSHQRIAAMIKREAEELNFLKKDSSFPVKFE